MNFSSRWIAIRKSLVKWVFGDEVVFEQHYGGIQTLKLTMPSHKCTTFSQMHGGQTSIFKASTYAHAAKSLTRCAIYMQFV